MTLRCSSCDESVFTCACPVDCDRYAPEAFHDLTITPTEAAVADRVRTLVASGGDVIEVREGEGYPARQALYHHAMLARLGGDVAEQKRIEAIRVVRRDVAAARAA